MLLPNPLRRGGLEMSRMTIVTLLFIAIGAFGVYLVVRAGAPAPDVETKGEGSSSEAVEYFALATSVVSLATALVGLAKTLIGGRRKT